jgi:hypothetical protein
VKDTGLVDPKNSDASVILAIQYSFSGHAKMVFNGILCKRIITDKTDS